MPEPRLHEPLIAEKIVQLIDQNLSGPLGLKVVTNEALEFFAAPDRLSDNVPAIFVKPSPSTSLERITTGQTYRIVYNFRLVYVYKFGPNEEVVKTKTTNTLKIAELLIDTVDLGALPLPNGQILSTTLKLIEWEPPEDKLNEIIKADMTVSALVFIVETTSRK